MSLGKKLVAPEIGHNPREDADVDTAFSDMSGNRADITFTAENHFVQPHSERHTSQSNE